MTNEQKQVIFSAYLGDGCINIRNGKIRVHYNSIHKEYIEYKQSMLGSLSSKISVSLNKGYKEGLIYQFSTISNVELDKYLSTSISNRLDELNELGLALWIYDDGSLHKNKHYYNINTHAFSLETQKELLVPLLNKFNIYPKIRKENKKDGRIFYYLQVSKYEGSYEISKILSKYPIACFNYKNWSSETIQKWSKFQEKLKSMQVNIKDLSPNKIGAIYRRLT